jgi:antitoxin VapB
MVEFFINDTERRTTMSLNVKDPETVELVHTLSKMTGESLTTAVRVAVKERIERQRPGRKEGLAKRILAIAKETAPLFIDGRTSKEMMDELYDPETGLPV